MVGIIGRQPPSCTRYGQLLLLSVGFAAAGCSKGMGDVSGRVMYQGKPVVSGSIVLAGSDGTPHRGQIAEDGKYSISGVPAEMVKVGVLSPDPAPAKRPQRLPPWLSDVDQQMKGITVNTGPAKKPKNWRPLPKKYEDPTTSGLTLEVNKGENTQDIMLN